MFKFNEYVNASSIWPTAIDHEDLGGKCGLARGYNIEVTKLDGMTGWMSCEYIYGEPEEEFNDDFHTWMYAEHGFTPTGRITFRGYHMEEYDYEERETYYVLVSKVEEELRSVKEEQR